MHIAFDRKSKMKDLVFLFNYYYFTYFCVFFNQSPHFVSQPCLPFMSAYYWVDKMDHLISSLIQSFFSSPSWILSGLKPSALWKPAMWHLAASSAPEGQRGPQCTFHGNAEQHPPPQLQPSSRILQRACGRCVRFWGLPSTPDPPACRGASTEVQIAKPQ